MLFRIKSSKLNQYGNLVTLTDTRRAYNAWEMSEILRKEGWTTSHIRLVNEERLKYSEARAKAYNKRISNG